MGTYTHSVEIGVPVHRAYEQWMRVEDFPQFMSEVEHVDQLTARRSLWRVSGPGADREFYALVTEQLPDILIAWRTTDDQNHGGEVLFEALSAIRTRVDLTMQYEPPRATEPSSAQRLGDHGVKRDLEQFKQFIEASPVPADW